MGGQDTDTFFLTNVGDAFTPERITQLVRLYVKQADIGKTGSCHLFQHLMATVMLENGADTRYIQEMLGHAKIDTTQIYTQVSIRHLKEVYDLAHPAKLEPTNHGACEADDNASEVHLWAALDADNEEELGYDEGS